MGGLHDGADFQNLGAGGKGSIVRLKSNPKTVSLLQWNSEQKVGAKHSDWFGGDLFATGRNPDYLAASMLFECTIQYPNLASEFLRYPTIERR